MAAQTIPALLMNGTCPTILLTRPAPASRKFAQRLRDAGVTAPIVTSPLMRINPVAVSLPEGLRGVLFTSMNGVAAVEGRSLPAWCVGDATAAAAARAGWQAISAGGDAEALYKRVLADAPHGPLLHLRGEHARGDLAQRLSTAGIETSETVVYRQTTEPLGPEARRLLSGNSPVLVPLFSPRSAETFLAEGSFRAPLVGIAISTAVADILAKAGVARIDVAAEPTADAMIGAILARLGAD